MNDLEKLQKAVIDAEQKEQKPRKQKLAKLCVSIPALAREPVGTVLVLEGKDRKHCNYLVRHAGTMNCKYKVKITCKTFPVVDDRDDRIRWFVRFERTS